MNLKLSLINSNLLQNKYLNFFLEILGHNWIDLKFLFANGWETFGAKLLFWEQAIFAGKQFLELQFLEASNFWSQAILGKAHSINFWSQAIYGDEQSLEKCLNFEAE